VIRLALKFKLDHVTSPRHVIQFKFQNQSDHISGITEARIVKFLTRVV